MFINIAMQIKKIFYKLIAVGLSTMYIFQVLLTIGGAVKFIPSTGVTLPFISYGGSSILSSLIVFSVIQGLYVKKASA
jgi:cell division protein FtsW (lipid II flippase)